MVLKNLLRCLHSNVRPDRHLLRQRVNKTATFCFIRIECMERQCKIGKTEWQPSLLVFIHFPNAFAPSAFEIGSNSMQSNSTAMLPVVLLLLSFFTIFLFPLKLMVEHSPELWWWIQVPQTDLRCTRKICFLWSDSLEFEHGFVLSLQLIWGGKKWLRVFLSKREWTGILMIWTGLRDVVC